MARFKIQIEGYGGELIIGKISKEAYEYWKDKDQEELVNFCFGFSDDDIPEEAMFCDPENWYEVDNIVHERALNINDWFKITVYDEDEEEVFCYVKDDETTENIDLSNLLEETREIYYTEQSSYLFFGYNIEEDFYVEGEFEADKFEPEKLAIKFIDYLETALIECVTYDGEVIENIEQGDGAESTGNRIFFVYKPEQLIN